MRCRTAVVPAGVLAIALLAGCGGAKQAAAPSTTAPARAVPPFRVTIAGATHTPRANAAWPVTIRVTDASGKPVAARLKMRILFGGAPVGQVDNGRVYRFVGSWREQPGQEITWPASAVGQPLTFQAVVTAKGRTRRVDFAVRVRK